MDYTASGCDYYNMDSLPTFFHDLSSAFCFCSQLKTELFCLNYFAESDISQHVCDSYLLLELKKKKRKKILRRHRPELGSLSASSYA